MVKLIDPFPGHYDASDPFGNIGIRDPNGPGHLGSDWNGLPTDSPVPAIASGTVVAVGFSPGNGYYVGQSLGSSGMYAGYIHLNSPGYVSVGQTIPIRTVIGGVGNTGTNSFGTHLHITISDDPQAWAGLGNKVDPYAYIMANLNGGGNIRFVETSAGPRMHRVI